MKFLKFWKIGKLALDGLRVIVRKVRNGKKPNKFERTLEDIDELTDSLEQTIGV